MEYLKKMKNYSTDMKSTNMLTNTSPNLPSRVITPILLFAEMTIGATPL